MQASLEILRTTLEYAIEAGADDGEEAVLEALDAYVDAHRRGGVAPERLLVDLKELTRAALRRHRLASGEPAAEDASTRALLDRVVRRAIERYYDSPG